MSNHQRILDIFNNNYFEIADVLATQYADTLGDIALDENLYSLINTQYHIARSRFYESASEDLYFLPEILRRQI